jgi:8-oxo-dGTP pyrophosphatase MutT (NUDIX family)
MKVVEASPNPFGGIVPAPDSLVGDPEEFRGQLRHSLGVWENEGYKVVWLEVPVSKAALVPVAVEAGFVFHHALEEYAMLTRRLLEDAYIPPYATHYVGVGGVVIDGDGDLLVVSEKYRARGRGPAYKLPGGALHPGEHIEDAAMREVLEETGVRTRFEALTCFRHWHGYRYGKSDIYFVCRLSPLSREISMQEDELEECLWMPVEEFLSSETIHVFNKTIVRAALGSPGIVPATVEGYGDREKFEFFMPEETI